MKYGRSEGGRDGRRSEEGRNGRFSQIGRNRRMVGEREGWKDYGEEWR